MKVKRRRFVELAATGTLLGLAGCVASPPSTPAAPQRGPGSGASAGGGSGPRGSNDTGDPGPHDPRSMPRDPESMPHAPGSRPNRAGPVGDGSASNGDGGTDLDQWFEDVDNYAGVVDRTWRSTVRVRVGAEGNGGAFAFDPAAIRVSPGTRVVWEWTGEGGYHDVVAVDGTFESDLAAEAGHTYEYAFDRPGTYRYVCTPHRSLGMKGAVVVDEA